jgi:hypothetical protein
MELDVRVCGYVGTCLSPMDGRLCMYVYYSTSFFFEICIIVLASETLVHVRVLYIVLPSFRNIRCFNFVKLIYLDIF